MADNKFIPILQNLDGGEQHAALTERWLRGQIQIPEIAQKWTSGLLIGYAAYVTTNRNIPTALNTGGNVQGSTGALTRDVTANMVSFRFEDARQSAGISFTHFVATRQSLLPEDMGS